mgnify:CR=1 FL=1
MEDKLAIIVPYRDREEHLNIFIPHMHSFLKNKGIDYTIFIAEQTDDRPFNYGKLCNVVTKEVGEEYTYFAFHDIDMLPISDECDYSYPDVPTHLATNVEAHENKLPYPQYFGGVVLISREDFEAANGYSNEYWGYGFEDLDLLYRLQRSDAYLEKFYDLNQTYQRYDEDDILPYRIENVDVSNKLKSHTLEGISIPKESELKARINGVMKKSISKSFSISIWFRDSSEIDSNKNVVSLEGMDSGLFLDSGKYVIAQVWDSDKKNYDVSLDYNKNKWNHLVYSLNYESKSLTLYCNNISNTIKLPSNFNIHPYYEYLKISNRESSIDIASMVSFDSVISDEVVSELFFNGFKTLDLIKNKNGLTPVNLFDFNSKYSNDLILDRGTSLNHLMVAGKLTPLTEDVETTSELYLPVRLDGKYKSLVHPDDSDIIKNYYKYNPDVEENADIFFNEVIPNLLDYKKIGLSTLEYKILDKQNRKTYELVRIVT